ncbi:kinase-like domain-containing protein [Glomus cerebriforme]|uniref:Kinase-like domain-containing protein n=1 Tax=Glomus cerebriforme TaxID=658196 RepID=A0A397SIN2_9GLOM|nr:kinase-like domain-containing protein [Glomus cerebriforme]
MERRSRKGDMDFVLRFAPPTREQFDITEIRRLFPSRQINIHEEIIIQGGLGLYEIEESNEILLNQLKISNQLIGNIAVIGESSKHFDVLISEILDLMKNILELYETIQYNKKICDCLIDRVESTEMAIKSLKRHKEENVGYFLQQEIYYGYHKFIDLLERIRQFITDISQLHGLRKFFSVENLIEHFKSIIKEFDDIVINLRLKVSYSKKDQDARDNEAVEYDGATLVKYLENVDGGITTSNKVINPIFDEIIMKRSQISDLKKVKIQTKKLTKLDTKNYDNNNNTLNNNNRGGNIHKMSYESKFVACKYYDSEQSPRFDNELAMLQLLNNSNNIINFLGLSDLDEGQVLIFDWAEYGDLQSLYENFTIDWPTKLNIALGICRGLSFLHGCQILHREIRCQNIMINEKLEPKVANFNFGRPAKYSRYFVENITAVVHWLAPEKLRQGTKVKFSSKCDIFSFGMLLWEIAFDVIPYKDWSYTNIIDHVKAGKRESIDFGSELSEVQKDFAKIIRAAWQDDPTLRPGLHELFNQLYDLTQRYPLKEFTSPKNKIVSTETDKKPSINLENNIVIDGDNDDPIPEVTDYKIDFLPMVQPILLIEEGIKLHKSGERKPAWECFQSHAELGNHYAKYWKAHYLTEGYHIQKDIKQGTKFFKEAADEEVADSQLRYAFSLYHDQIIQDTDAFLQYLTLAAENGNATAQFNLGRMYYAGMVGLNRDKEKGLQYLKMAALKNQPRAIQFLNSVKIDRYI